MAAQHLIGSQLSEAFIKVADECIKLDAMPAFNQGVTILQALERIQTQMQEMHQVQLMQQQTLQQMHETHQTLEQRIHQLEQNMERGFNDLRMRHSTSNINAIARTQNSMVGCADRDLATLVNVHTSEVIEGFPNTAAAIGRMPSAVVNRVLLALDLNTNGNLDERRTRMSIAIGLKIGGV